MLAARVVAATAGGSGACRPAWGSAVASAAGAAAFARRSVQHAAIVLAPRLLVGLAGDGMPPLAAAAWADTRVELPAELAGARFTNVFTGEPCALAQHDGRATLSLASALGRFPVALYCDAGLD